MCSFHKTIQESLLLFKIGPALPEISNSQVFSGARACGVRGEIAIFTGQDPSLRFQTFNTADGSALTGEQLRRWCKVVISSLRGLSHNEPPHCPRRRRPPKVNPRPCARPRNSGGVTTNPPPPHTPSASPPPGACCVCVWT